MRYILRYNIFEGINNDKKELFEGKTGIPFDEIEGWIYYIGGENLEIKNIFGFPMGKFDGIDYHDSFEINIKSIKNTLFYKLYINFFINIFVIKKIIYKFAVEITNNI